MKKLLITVLFTMLIVVLAGCGEKPTASEFIAQENEQLLYKNHEKGFSFVMPATWDYKESAELDQISFLSPKESETDAFQENFYAGAGTTTNPFKKNLTPEQVYEGLIEKAQNSKGDVEGFTFTGYDYITIANQKALMLTFTGTSEDAPDLHITFTQWYLSEGATNYMCQYTAQTEHYNIFLPVVEAALASFEYTETTPASSETSK